MELTMDCTNPMRTSIEDVRSRTCEGLWQHLNHNHIPSHNSSVLYSLCAPMMHSCSTVSSPSYDVTHCAGAPRCKCHPSPRRWFPHWSDWNYWALQWAVEILPWSKKMRYEAPCCFWAKRYITLHKQQAANHNQQ